MGFALFYAKQSALLELYVDVAAAIGCFYFYRNTVDEISDMQYSHSRSTI